MTHAEFEALADAKSPMQATRAERAAAREHGRTCPKCHAFAEKVKREMPLAYLISLLIAQQFDEQDAEADDQEI